MNANITENCHHGTGRRCGDGHILDTKSRKVSKLCPNCVQNMSKLSPNLQYVQIMSKRCPCEVQKVSTLVYCVQNVSKPESYFWTLFGAWETSIKMSKRCPKGVQTVSKCLDTILTHQLEK